MLERKVLDAELAYCRQALSVALERAIFTMDEAERARALEVVTTLEERLTKALAERTRVLAY